MADRSPTDTTDDRHHTPDETHRQSSCIENAFNGRVPPADAATAPDNAFNVTTARPDLHHRDHTTHDQDFLDQPSSDAH